MSIFEKLTSDMKDAMKAGDKERLSTIRLLRGQIKDAAIDKRDDLDEEEEIVILSNAAKKRRESIKIYSEAGRDDLAGKEQRELDVIQSYLPQQLSAEEIEKIVDEAIEETGAQSMKDMGRLMGAIMPTVQGRADGKQINEMIRQKLS
ncbi:MAG: GatB/YqeY domain-containing protein [Calditrichaeota bacterium]|nr:GatB/YqeY domain-containing protein [Calditrichota bacterium]